MKAKPNEQRKTTVEWSVKTNSDGMHWHAIHVYAQREARVREELERKGIEAYFPAWREKRKWSDRETYVDKPLFTGYLFARFCDAPESQRPILDTPGVARIVGAVSDEEIMSIRQVMKLPADKVLVQPLSAQPGDTVRLKIGKWAGMDAEFVRSKGECRVIVRIPMLGRQLETVVAVEDVAVIHQKAA